MNLDYFYHRCATEGGSDPLRNRCLLCCNEDKPDDDDFEDSDKEYADDFECSGIRHEYR